MINKIFFLNKTRLTVFGVIKRLKASLERYLWLSADKAQYTNQIKLNALSTVVLKLWWIVAPF